MVLNEKGERVPLKAFVEATTQYWDERRTAFREYVDMLDTLYQTGGEDVFAFTPQNFPFLLNMVSAFDNNAGTGRINTNDLERFGEVGEKITLAVMKSAKLDSSLLSRGEFKRMGLQAADDGLKLNLNFRKEGNKSVIDEYTFKPDGTITTKRVSW